MLNTTTDNQQELFYHVDNQDNVLGSMTRAEAHDRTMKIHRAVSVLVFNPDKSKVLLQQRSMTKDTNPGYWTISASGHVTYGESYEQAVAKELFEEVGIRSEIQPFQKILTSDDIYQEKEWDMIFTTTISEDTPLTLHPQEVEQVVWVPTIELSAFLQHNSFTNCGKQVLSAYFPDIKTLY